MARIDEESLCYPHGWVGRGECLRCVQELKRKADAYQARWQAMSLEERVEELRRRLDETRIDPLAALELL